MSIDTLKELVKLIFKHWKIIIAFTLITLVMSGVYNFKIKKIPEPVYNAQSSIDFSGILFYGDTQPSVKMDAMQVQTLFDTLAVKLNIDKNASKLYFELPTQQKIIIKGLGTNHDLLENFIHMFLEQIELDQKTKHAVEDPKKISDSISDDIKKDVFDNTGNITLNKVLSIQKKLIDEQSAVKGNISGLKSNIDSIEFEISSSNYLLKDIEYRSAGLTGENLQYLERKVFKLKLDLDSFIFKRNYFNERLKNYESKLTQLNKDFETSIRLYNSTIFNTNMKEEPYSSVTVGMGISKGRNILVSVILSLIIMILLVFFKEYYGIKVYKSNMGKKS